ncbi:MAG: nuclear transport factor 2 family protein [Pseudomonadota bacterium]
MGDAKLQELLDKQAIAEVVTTYARAIDRLDEALLRSVFHPGSRHSHGFVGPSSDPSLPSTPEQPGDFVAFAFGALRTHTRTHHQLGNIMVELDGIAAYVETYFTAYHRMRAQGDPLAAPAAAETEMDFWVGGRYLDRFEKRDGHWKITHRTGLTDWMRTEPPRSQGYEDLPPELLGCRSEDDLVYRRREQFEV